MSFCRKITGRIPDKGILGRILIRTQFPKYILNKYFYNNNKTSGRITGFFRCGVEEGIMIVRCYCHTVTILILSTLAMQ